MPDLETRLREAVADRSEAFVPSPDLPERAVRRARRRERTRRLSVASAVASLVVVVSVATSLVLRPADDAGDEFEMQPPPATTAPPKDGGTAPRPPTTATETTASTAVPAPDDGTPDPTGTIGPDTPLTMTGIGPIQVGMTLREVEQALGMEPVVDEYGTQGFECWRATFAGIDGLQVEVGPAGEDESEPLDFVVSFVSGRPTPEGIDVGSSVGEVRQVYGEPDDTLPRLDVSGDLLVYEAESQIDGYGFLTDGSTVVEVRGGSTGGMVSPDAIC